MNWKALQKRAKKTEKEEKETIVQNKNGDKRTIHKYKRKKRLGKSCRTRAPAMLETILRRKTKQHGGTYTLIDTRSIKPSQYDHVSGKFIKTDARIKTIGDVEVQRDLYAAFIGYCTKEDGKTFDKKKADKLFKHFVTMQNELIEKMKQDGISMPQCFGF